MIHHLTCVILNCGLRPVSSPGRAEDSPRRSGIIYELTIPFLMLLYACFVANNDAGGAGFRLRGLGPTLGTCVGNPTVGKRQIVTYRFPHVESMWDFCLFAKEKYV